jgi:hypothetical protein
MIGMMQSMAAKRRQAAQVRRLQKRATPQEREVK